MSIGQNKLDEFTFGIQFKPIVSVAYFNAGEYWHNGTIILLK